MQSEAYWRQLETEARETATRTNSAAWVKLADLYRENAERTRTAEQSGQESES